MLLFSSPCSLNTNGCVNFFNEFIVRTIIKGELNSIISWLQSACMKIKLITAFRARSFLLKETPIGGNHPYLQLGREDYSNYHRQGGEVMRQVLRNRLKKEKIN
jgi:hypothetical protein